MALGTNIFIYATRYHQECGSTVRAYVRNMAHEAPKPQEWNGKFARDAGFTKAGQPPARAAIGRIPQRQYIRRLP